MARKPKLPTNRQAKQNVKLAPKLDKNHLAPLGKVLVFAGKPFYLTLTYLAITLLFTIYWTGRITRLFLGFLIFITLKFLNKLPDLIKKPDFTYKLKGVKLLGLKLKLRAISLPKLKLPKISFKFRTALVILITLFSLFWLLILKDLPSPKELVTRKQEMSTKIYDRNGELLFKIYKDKNRTPVSLNQVPIQVRLATLAAEDAEFYQHLGFSVRGIMRSTIRNATRGELAGGSTITQQLVKNALLSSEKTIIRKVREIVLAIGVELTFTKDEILEMYLNEVSYGGTAYGIEEASQVYFAKDVGSLNLAEAALLAGLPKSPTKYSPFGPNPDFAIERQREVIRLMRINKYISEEQEEAALNEKLSFAPNKIDIKAPHFVMSVKQSLVEKYGEELIEKGGLEITTTLDYSVQKMAEEAVTNEIERLSSLNVTNGAALVMNPQTGEILAMVGSKNYFDTEAGGNVNVITRLRQPGSAIKPINYAYALSNGHTLATILADTPVIFSIQGQEPYSPKNYDGKFRGSISLRSALAESRNVPAVKVLANYGVNKMIEMGQKMGITTWEDTSRFGLSLTLGGGDIKLIDLAKAYATLANYGERPDFVSILSATNYKGEVIEENVCTQSKLGKYLIGLTPYTYAAEAAKNVCEREQVVDPRVAFLLTDILSDNQARAPAFGSQSLLNIPGHPEVAVKTGTSNDLRDNLAIGYNQDYLVAVWVGNNDNSPMARVASGITGATPIWNKIMSTLLANEQNKEWEVPEGLKEVPVCTLTGTLPCEGCPVRLEWFLEENQPQKACRIEQVLKEKEKKEKAEGEILEPAARTEQ
ncbi:transglycosylase domain-containing protein [Patescibacteria group bacterium]|nr:transglycosylase domain-containing protein [Patescibacteria group bacterium]MBU0777405.1 transglycosylase domain-containing protein [Patescibacteria group bacterium]MBU0846041.1 transglycosylase domain-containing protein [Patescibacteria group bacterium]MBU0922459.1 transglycosylase domain-containing protein [Patescibacteria group bacterium]MBU1066808.1 transglycosylase domain-containing protein [Patescibacteria group bacterium]